MPIRWSALKVSEALDQVEQQLNLADAFLADAEEKAREATGIHNLPQYMFGRFSRLEQVIQDGRRRPREAVHYARRDIPEGAVEAERKRGRQHELTL